LLSKKFHIKGLKVFVVTGIDNNDELQNLYEKDEKCVTNVSPKNLKGKRPLETVVYMGA
jgi:hypothetical protein